jgi:hypothetical protein
VMGTIKIWAITLIVASAYLAVCSEIDYRAAQIERCSVVRCNGMT